MTADAQLPHVTVPSSHTWMAAGLPLRVTLLQIPVHPGQVDYIATAVLLLAGQSLRHVYIVHQRAPVQGEPDMTSGLVSLSDLQVHFHERT